VGSASVLGAWRGKKLGRFWRFSGVLGRGWWRCRGKIPDRGAKRRWRAVFLRLADEAILHPRCWIGLRIGAFFGFWGVLGRGWWRCRGKIPVRG